MRGTEPEELNILLQDYMVYDHTRIKSLGWLIPKGQIPTNMHYRFRLGGVVSKDKHTDCNSVSIAYKESLYIATFS